MASDTTAARGEEFRDDLRGTAAGPAQSPVAQVRRLLPPATLADLTRLSAWRSTLAVATTLGTLALVLGVAWTYFTWWIVLPAVVLIGTQQHALFVLAHDAAHYRLYGTRWLNDAIGRFVGTIGGVSMMSYRVIHR
ncbi:MAG TPA: fatty acid desaturase, partial [Burkholderiaceae bacterium]|nr:fatty acid desaturase [Burkholderiaceae bacterium]